MRLFLAIFLIIGVLMIFATMQLHIAAANMHLHAEQNYQNTLQRLCPKHPEDTHCNDLGRKNWTESYERWIVQFGVK